MKDLRLALDKNVSTSINTSLSNIKFAPSMEISPTRKTQNKRQKTIKSLRIGSSHLEKIFKKFLGDCEYNERLSFRGNVFSCDPLEILSNLVGESKKEFQVDL